MWPHLGRAPDAALPGLRLRALPHAEPDPFGGEWEEPETCDLCGFTHQSSFEGYRIGWHYTSWENYERIREVGLRPYRQPKIDAAAGEEIWGVWAYLHRHGGRVHVGSVMYQMVNRPTSKVVLLKPEELLLRSLVEKTPWVVVHDGTQKPAYTMECRRCGATARLELPVSVAVFVATSRAFVREHRGCQ